MDTYPINLIISYNNDFEYRKCINNLFSCNDNDEYDDKSATVFLDFVFRKTKNIYSFKSLYIISASSMMSTDQSLGLIVLLSYTYLESFHKCLVFYFTNLTTYKKDIENNESYQVLLNLLKQ